MIRMYGAILSLFVILLLGFPNVASFHFKSCASQFLRLTRVTMGRSLEEQKVSKKELFRRIRDDVNKAASQPGFLAQENIPVSWIALCSV